MSEQLLGLQQPIVPPIMVDSNYPPYVPNVRVHPEVEYLRGNVSALVINEAVEKIITNHSRLFLFNLISYNSYQNETFHEIVELVLGHIYINTKRGKYRSYDMALFDSVSYVMTGYASYLFFRYPNLKSMVAPQIVNAAYQNLQSFTNLKEEVNSMFATGGYPNSVPNNNMVPMHNMVPVHPNMQMNNMQPQQQFVQYPAVPMHPNMQRHNQQPQTNMFVGNMVNQSAFINRGEPVQQNARDSRFRIMSENNDKQIQQQPVQQVIDQGIEQPIVEEKPAKEQKDKTVVLEMECGSEKDFCNSTVTFLDISVDLNNFDRSAKQYSSIMRLGKEHAYEEQDVVNKYVRLSPTLENNLENAIISARVNQYEMQKNESRYNVFRCFSIIANPFFSTYDLGGYYRVIQACDNFEGLVGKLRSIAMAVSGQEDKSYVAAVVTFLNVIDELLTDLVNDFLRNKIDMKIDINSFTNDAIDLKPYLFKKDPKYSEAYEQFENDVMSVVFEELDSELLQLSAEDLELPQGLNHYVLPVNHTLTLTFLNDKELGMKIKDGLNVIDATNCNSLYNIAVSLFHHKKEAGITTLVDYLITIDNRRYKLYKDYCKTNTFYIRKA